MLQHLQQELADPSKASPMGELFSLVRGEQSRVSESGQGRLVRDALGEPGGI